MNVYTSQDAFTHFTSRTSSGHLELHEDVFSIVQKIQSEILRDRDLALFSYTTSLDRLNTPLKNLLVSADEIQAAYQEVSPELVKALRNAKKNIEAFHHHQLPQNWEEKTPDGSLLGIRYQPIEIVGLYVPGGRAVYPSTVLMNAIPAKLAGVSQAIMVTPPRPDGTIHPSLLVAADLCGVDVVLKCGGAQAVFALAYGTESVPKVDKIVGPGNKYVTLAKQLVYGQVDIDKPAGPSEVLVYVEDSKQAAVAAAELIAQLEHDPDAIAIALSPSESVLREVMQEVMTQKTLCSREAIIDQSLRNVMLIITENQDDAVAWINRVASEHLVLLVDDYEPLLNRVKHAGAVFCGLYSPVTIGDYYAGSNHVLPTGTTARFASPLGVSDFVKYMSVVSYTKEMLNASASDLKVLTETEGFDGHYRAVSIRL